MIDGHCHLDGSIGNVRLAIKNLHKDAKKSGVEGVILLNIPDQGYTNEEVLQEVKEYSSYFFVFPGIPNSEDINKDTIENLVKKGAKGLKLHPRLHGYSFTDMNVKKIMSLAHEFHLPVLIDCFPDGKNLVLGNMPEKIGLLAEMYPEVRIAMGHAGGHHILDAMMIAKYYKNIFLDLSFTFLYFRETDVSEKIRYCMKNMRYNRIFLGTDFPDRNYSLSVELINEEMGKMGLSEVGKKLVLYDNVSFFLRGVK